MRGVRGWVPDHIAFVRLDKARHDGVCTVCDDRFEEGDVVALWRIRGGLSKWRESHDGCDLAAFYAHWDEVVA